MNRLRIPMVLVMVAVLLAAPGVAGAQPYRWVDSKGQVHYSDTPPQPSAMQEPADVTAARKAVLDDTLRALTAGSFDRIIARYRLFEESREPATVAENKRLLKRYFTLLRSGLGKPAGFQAARDLSPDFELNPVPSHVWDGSDCSIGEHAYKVTLADGAQRRPADMLVKTCYGTATGKTWLRSVTIVSGEPVKSPVVSAPGTPPAPGDPAFAAVMTRFMDEVKDSCARNPTMDSCDVLTATRPKPTEKKEPAPQKDAKEPAKPAGPAATGAPKPDAPGAPKPGAADAPKPR